VKRPLVLLAVTAVAALLLSACGSTGDPDAATVGKTAITRSQLDDELKIIGANKALAKELKAQGVELNPTDGGLSTAVTTGWLTSLVNQVFVDRVFEEKNLKVTAEEKTAAKAAAEAIFVNAEVFGEFPESFQKTVIERQERIEAVKASLPQPEAASEAALQQFFESSKAQFCPSGTVVAHILVPTQAAADLVKASIDGGADFATVAEEQSTDTGSAARGGLVACTDTQQFGQLDPAFQAAVSTTPVGSVSAPVQTQFGFHVIKVAPWDFATARPVIEEAYAQQQGTDNPLTEFLNARLNDAKLWVDPRYGTVERTAAGVAIAPPKTPKPKTRPTTTTTVDPTGQAPTGQDPSQTPTPTP
jgi:parvulin-like peptidyl-prolyl isomerase